MNIKIYAKGNPIVVESGAVYVEHATQQNYYHKPQPQNVADSYADAEEVDGDSPTPQQLLTPKQWAEKYFKQVNTIYPTVDALATKATSVRTRYGEEKAKLSGNKHWKSIILERLFFVMDGAQWLTDSNISLEAVVELTGDNEITSRALTSARQKYRYLQN